MVFLKYLLEFAGFSLAAAAVAIAASDLYRTYRQPKPDQPPWTRPVRWRFGARLLAAGVFVWLAGVSIVIVPSGMAGVRISQFSGTLPGTLYPGVHAVVPLVQSVELFSTRSRVYQTLITTDPKAPGETLKVQTREGLLVSLAVSVRHRIEPKRLDYVHTHLPVDVDGEIVRPVVASAFREAAPNYLVLEFFATRREQMRSGVAQAITRKLSADGIVVEEVLLRDVLLPSEYARSLEGMIVKQQENERLSVEIDVKQKMVRVAELEAEAQKARDVKHAEGQAQMTVIQAKAQADAMQHTLPLKEKQIQQSRLEAEARKESTVKNAEAAALAKVIDGKAEVEKRKLMNEAESHRIKLLAVADAERLKTEAAVLKENPLLIQKIIAERLSDKVQIMMVPNDGKFFFANDVLRGMSAAVNTQQ